MGLEPGVRLGQYAIVELLGRGGMGEVYRARDTRLGREVALKVLPQEVARDPERLGRFEREAKSLAALNHSSIATLFGMESHGETPFLVMEVVEGPTLADRIALGPIPVAEAVALFLQIAEGLEAAHQRGIIHRDLKPANIKLCDGGGAALARDTPRPGSGGRPPPRLEEGGRPHAGRASGGRAWPGHASAGRIKILDFGLAKAMAPRGVASGDPLQSPTLTYTAPREGRILGTPAYMSPEQARGHEVDQRCDIWSFGVCFYEALSGRRAFEGGDTADTLAAVLTADVDWTALPREAPGAIRRLLRRCLEKEPHQRLHSMADARLELEEALTSPEPPEWATLSVPPLPAPALPGRMRRLLPSTAALLAGVILTTLVFRAAVRPPAAHGPVSRTVLSAPPSAAPFVAVFMGATDIAITPDGTKVVYLHQNEGGYHNLYLRPVDRLEGMPLTDGRGFTSPFVSPDGAWLGFNQGGLKKMPILGGPPLAICETGLVTGASWGTDDSIVFTQAGPEPGLYRVPAAGGQPEALVAPDLAGGEVQYSTPEVLPGGAAVLFTVRRGETSEIAILDLRSQERRTLIAEGSRPRYASTGHLVYGRGGTLFAVRFDLARLDVAGEPERIVDGVVTESFTAAPNFALSQTGRLVYITGETPSASLRNLVWVDRNGGAERVSLPAQSYTRPRIGPDGRRAALEVSDGRTWSIWIWDFARETLTPLATDGASDAMPVWSPDGRRIFFNRNLNLRIYEKAADGSGVAELVADEPVWTPTSISPDGRWLIGRSMQVSDDIWALSLERREARPLLASAADERNGELSPDGRWLAYESNESGRFEIYVRPFPAVEEGRWPISRGGGTQPLWSRDGRELFYHGARGVMAVSVETGGDELRAGRAEMLFERRFPPNDAGLGRQYDVSADGNRFLVLEDVEPAGSEPRLDVILVDNWFAELERLVPAK